MIQIARIRNVEWLPTIFVSLQFQWNNNIYVQQCIFYCYIKNLNTITIAFGEQFSLDQGRCQNLNVWMKNVFPCTVVFLTTLSRNVQVHRTENPNRITRPKYPLCSTISYPCIYKETARNISIVIIIFRKPDLRL